MDGACSICGKHGALTVDHIPPKGAIRISAVEMMSLFHRISAEPKAERPAFSQNGVKFRSLCADCNNVCLGVEADPELISLTSHIATLFKSSLVLPATLIVRAKPHTILRSIIGHSLGAGVGLTPAGPFAISLAEYFLDKSKPIPTALDCYYWPYPYNDQVVVHTAALTTTLGSGQKPTVFKLIKFFPLAFMMTWEREEGVTYGLENLCDHRNLGPDDEADIRINIRPLPHQLWPEAPTGNAAILYGEKTLFAKPRGLKKK
jgi:hypothetical protein